MTTNPTVSGKAFKLVDSGRDKNSGQQALPVSIVLTVHDRERYLMYALDSVLRQTIPGWELICIDDGSRDGSGAILDRYAASHERIRVIHTPNRGVSAARNLGLVQSQGAWVTFMDDDDWLQPEFLERMLESADDADMVACMIYVEPFGDIHSYTSSPLDYWDPVLALAENLGRPYCWLLPDNTFNKLYRRSVLMESASSAILHPFEEHLSYGENTIFNLDNWHLFRHIRILPDALYHYNLHNGPSLSRRFDLYEPRFRKRLFQRYAHVLSGRAAPLRPSEYEALLHRAMCAVAADYKRRICDYFTILCSVGEISRPDKLLSVQLMLSEDLFSIAEPYANVAPAGNAEEKVHYQQLWEILRRQDAMKICSAFAGDQATS